MPPRVPSPRPVLQPLRWVHVLVALIALGVAAWLIVTVPTGRLLVPVASVLTGVAYGGLLFRFPPRQQGVGLALLFAIPAVFIALTAAPAPWGPSNYGWILGVIAGGTVLGRSMRRR